MKNTYTARPTPSFYLEVVGEEDNPLPEYKITFWPEVGFQLCPKCNGEGGYFDRNYTGKIVCPVCAGKMIINCKTGRPPE